MKVNDCGYNYIWIFSSSKSHSFIKFAYANDSPLTIFWFAFFRGL
jgi:hypothetical protein